MNENKLLTLLGFSYKAMQLSAGTEAVKNALSKKRGSLMLIANDISLKSQEKWLEKASEYNIPAYIALDKKKLAWQLAKAPELLF